MTKKDYELIAMVISEQYNVSQRNYYEEIAVMRLAQHLAIALQDSNPKFDRAKFLTACGIKD